MEKIILIFSSILITNHGINCIVTDKEYAHLPPIFELDNWEKCMLLDDDALYCYMEFQLKPKNEENPSKTWKNIQELNLDKRNYRHDILRHGVCVPFTCPNISLKHTDSNFNEKLEECYSRKFENQELYGTIGKINCETNQSPSYDFLDYLAILFFVAYGILLIFASFYEGLARYKTPEEYKKITSSKLGKTLTCFSIPNNWIRLTTVNMTPELEKLRAMQGIRFYNMLIVIASHGSFIATAEPIAGTKWIEKLTEHPLTIFMASGSFAVQTFFLMSSWLLTSNIFQNFDKKSGREFNLKIILQIFIARYLRIIPPLAVMTIIHSTLLYHTGNGPFWESLAGREKEFCRENGWTNFFGINNFINPSRMCFIQTWYTAVDLQYFILILPILYFTVKKPKRLVWLLPTVWIMSTAITLKRLYDNDISTTMEPYAENFYLLRGVYKVDGKWINTIGSTSTHIGGIIVGIAFGYIYYKYQNTQIFTKKIHTVLWWLMFFGVGLSIIIFPGLWLFSPHFYPTPWFTYPYFGLSLTIFSISIAIGIFGMSQGVGWMAKWCCEWKPTYVLGRISYTTFLVHYAYLFYRSGSIKHLYNASEMEMINTTVEIIAFSLFYGLLLSLAFELPVSAIQSNFIFRKSKENNETKKKEPKNIEKQEKLKET